jgi:hypothetical protein
MRSELSSPSGSTNWVLLLALETLRRGILSLAVGIAWDGMGFDGGHFGLRRSCSRTCASSFWDSSCALVIPGAGADDNRGDGKLLVVPWEGRKGGNVTWERARALCRKVGDIGEVDMGVESVSDISRRRAGAMSFSL